MNISASAAAGGLYSFKSWYADLLAPVRRILVAADVPPTAVTMAGIAFGGGAGAALAWLRPGPVAGTVVAALLAARLGCANRPPTAGWSRRPRRSCRWSPGRRPGGWATFSPRRCSRWRWSRCSAATPPTERGGPRPECSGPPGWRR